MHRDYLPLEVRTPKDMEVVFRRIEAQYPAFASEFRRITLAKVHHWRTVCRIACVNTKVHLGTHLNQDRALRLTKKALGPSYCPPDLTLRRDAFRAIAIALSLHTRTLVTPERASMCFQRDPFNQRFQVTDYGESLLESAMVTWPPMPAYEVELVDVDWTSILQPKAPDTADFSLSAKLQPSGCLPETETLKPMMLDLAYCEFPSDSGGNILRAQGCSEYLGANELPAWVSNLDVSDSLPGISQLQPVYLTSYATGCLEHQTRETALAFTVLPSSGQSPGDLDKQVYNTTVSGLQSNMANRAMTLDWYVAPQF